MTAALRAEAWMKKNMPNTGYCSSTMERYAKEYAAVENADMLTQTTERLNKAAQEVFLLERQLTEMKKRAEIAEAMARDADKNAEGWKREFNMYRSAWLREMGGKIVIKAHEIDGFVLRTRQLYLQAQKWVAYENGQLLRDPFWMVPEPTEEKR